MKLMVERMTCNRNVVFSVVDIVCVTETKRLQEILNPSKVKAL